jgi:hypothetical protein
MSYIYNYPTDPRTIQYSGTNPTETLALILFIVALGLIGYAIYAWILGRIFHKAGISKTIAWIPFYNNWKLLELGDQQGFWSILLFIPIINYVATVFLYIAQYRIGLKFGKAGWWVVLAIFIPFIWLILLAFDQSKWHKTIPAQPDSYKV